MTYRDLNPHGDVRRYWMGCRCILCRFARAQYWRVRKEGEKGRQWNAGYLRRRILSLNGVGMDNPAVADAAGVPLPTILDILSGHCRHVSTSIASRIRAIELRTIWEGRRLDIRATRRLIEHFRLEGFTPEQIAARLQHERQRMEVST